MDKVKYPNFLKHELHIFGFTLFELVTILALQLILSIINVLFDLNAKYIFPSLVTYVLFLKIIKYYLPRNYFFYLRYRTNELDWKDDFSKLVSRGTF